MPRLLTRCPVCEESLRVTEVSCASCGTRISGRFDSCRFCQAAPEHLTFVEVFLRCEGNISRVERELGISYPTVRNRLASALQALGLTGASAESPPPPPEPRAAGAGEERRRILDALSSGSLSAAEAADLIRQLS